MAVVTTDAPTKRGLKLYRFVLCLNLCGVTTDAPTKRGLNCHVGQFPSENNGYL